MKWISVEEMLPDEGVGCLLQVIRKNAYGYSPDFAIGLYEGEDFGWNTYGEPTHWMPLPEPPDSDA